MTYLQPDLVTNVASLLRERIGPWERDARVVLIYLSERDLLKPEAYANPFDLTHCPECGEPIETNEIWNNRCDGCSSELWGDEV